MQDKYMPLKHIYKPEDESLANRFRLYEIFDMDRMVNIIDMVSADIEDISGFSRNISVDWNRRPDPSDQKYTYPAFRWTLKCDLRIYKKNFFIHIESAFNGIYLKLNRTDSYMPDTKMQEFVFGDINKNSIFTKDIYQLPRIIFDIMEELKKYYRGK